MPDVFTKAERSALMARVRGEGNRDTELRLIALMRAAGITGWRRGVRLKFAARPKEEPSTGRARPRRGTDSDSRFSSVRSVPSVVQLRSVTIRPDFVFREHRLVVFVDGCFWHGCPRHATWPAHNAAFWRAKIEGNRARDRAQTRWLRSRGWRVLRIWEHALKPRLATRTVGRLTRALQAPERAGTS